MRRPSFQFYPADWRTNAKIRRCSEAARGAWMDIMCVLHDSDEYGILRWPLEDIARSAGVSLKSAQELSAKQVFKGSDSGIKPFTYTTRHAGQDGDTFTLIEKTNKPCWFCSRMVVDEFIRGRRGMGSRFTADNQPTRPPTRPVGGRVGDGPSSSSSSSSSSSVLRSTDKASDKAKKLSKIGQKIAQRFENCLKIQWVNDAGKWVNRIKNNPDKSERVVAEVENAIKEKRIATTPAQYAEQIWKEFK